MPAPYSTKSIANFFLNKGFATKTPIDPLKIQKLVFLANGYYLASTGVPLINESFEAWPKGPVVPSLYHEFKGFGFSPITRLAEDLDWGLDANVPVPIPDDDPKMNKVVNFVWEKYASVPSTALSALTHRPGGPWDKAMKLNVHGLKGFDISSKLVKEYFDTFVKPNHGAHTQKENAH